MPVCEPGKFIMARKTGSSGPGRSQLALLETTAEEETRDRSQDGEGFRLNYSVSDFFGLTTKYITT